MHTHKSPCLLAYHTIYPLTKKKQQPNKGTHRNPNGSQRTDQATTELHLFGQALDRARCSTQGIAKLIVPLLAGVPLVDGAWRFRILDVTGYV